MKNKKHHSKLASIKRLEGEYTNEYCLRKEFQDKLEASAPECYCTNKVPETDCEGCNFVMSCTNFYDPSEVSNE